MSSLVHHVKILRWQTWNYLKRKSIPGLCALMKNSRNFPGQIGICIQGFGQLPVSYPGLVSMAHYLYQNITTTRFNIAHTVVHQCCTLFTPPPRRPISIPSISKCQILLWVTCMPKCYPPTSINLQFVPLMLYHLHQICTLLQ